MLEDSPFIEALALYAEITGVAVPQSENDRYGSKSMGAWKTFETYEHLKEALELDPTEVTANLMLSFYTRDMLKDQKLSMLALLNDPEAFLAKLEKPRRLLAIVNREDITEARTSFIEALRTALSRYGADKREDVAQLLTQHDNIAFLRRDALRGVERLRMDQFLRGAPEADDYKPVFHTKVYQWWNINSLLSAALSMPSGVSLNLIRDRDAFQSYFVYCIRNGGNLYILSDAPEYAHPLQGQMTRRPDRALGSRSCQAWFPYDLLGLKWDEEAERFYVENSDEKGVAVYQQEHKVLKEIAELSPEETLWTTMMLDLIVRKFWGQGFQAPALSYTGEMIRIEDKLIAKAQTQNLPVTGYEPLSMPALAVEDILTDVVDEKQVGKKAHSPNRWLEERYKDRINPEVINATEQIGTALLLPGYKGRYEADAKKLGGQLTTTGLRKMTSAEVARLTHWEQKDVRDASLQVMDTTKFGTREQLEADRLFIARHNMASQINQLATEEFERREKEVLAWYTKACKKNLPAILTWAANEEIWLDMGLKADFSRSTVSGPQRSRDIGPENGWRTGKRVMRSIVKRRNLVEEKRTKDYDYSSFGAINLGDYEREYRCAVTGAKATYLAVFYPCNAIELALLAGCEVADLPDVLQHWTLEKDYIGNSILNRIDPMNWQAHDPWRKLKFKLAVPLSILGLRKIEKAPALPPLTNVITTEDAHAYYRETDTLLPQQIIDDLTAVDDDEPAEGPEGDE